MSGVVASILCCCGKQIPEPPDCCCNRSCFETNRYGVPCQTACAFTLAECPSPIVDYYILGARCVSESQKEARAWRYRVRWVPSGLSWAPTRGDDGAVPPELFAYCQYSQDGSDDVEVFAPPDDPDNDPEGGVCEFNANGGAGRMVQVGLEEIPPDDIPGGEFLDINVPSITSATLESVNVHFTGARLSAFRFGNWDESAQQDCRPVFPDAGFPLFAPCNPASVEFRVLLTGYLCVQYRLVGCGGGTDLRVCSIHGTSLELGETLDPTRLIGWESCGLDPSQSPSGTDCGAEFDGCMQPLYSFRPNEVLFPAEFGAPCTDPVELQSPSGGWRSLQFTGVPGTEPVSGVEVSGHTIPDLLEGLRVNVEW